MDIDQAGKCQCLDINTLKWSDAIGDVLVMIDQLRTEPFMADELDVSVALKCERLRALLPAEPVSGEDPA